MHNFIYGFMWGLGFFLSGLFLILLVVGCIMIATFLFGKEEEIGETGGEDVSV